MKKILFIGLMILLPLSMTGCKKDNKEVPQKTEKTVDLGETAKTSSPKESKKDANGPKTRREPPHKKEIAPKGPRKGKADELPPKDKNKDDAPVKEDDKKIEKADAAALDEKKDNLNTQDQPEEAKEEKKQEENTAENAVNDDNIPKAPEMRKPQPKSSLSIEKLINIRELREQTGYAGAFADAWLPGQVLDARYNAMRLSTDNDSKLGFAIQVWKPGNESAASKRFNDLFTQSFGGQKIKDVATDAFSASHHKINELGFFEKSKRATVLLSCSDDICTVDQLKSIAQIIQRRL